MTADAAEFVRLRQENERLRRELAEARREQVAVRPQLRLPPLPGSRPKPRVSLAEARRMAALAVEMWLAPDRPEDPDA